MEALVILLAEFLFIPVVAFTALVGNASAAILTSIFEFVFWIFFGIRSDIPKKARARQKEAELSEKTQRISPRTSRILRQIRRISLALLALIVSALVIINLMLFEPVAKWVLAKVEQKTGIELDVEEISGNVFTGTIAFHNLSAKRQSKDKSSFDLNVGDVAVDIDVWSLVAHPITLEKLSVTNVQGTINKPDLKKVDGKKATFAAAKIRAKRIFMVEDLKLTDINLALSKGVRPPVKLSLQQVASQPFRSNYAIFDVFFRSNISGTIDGHEISISTEVIEGGRVTKWDINELPVATVASFVTKPPVGWFKSGTIDIEVEDRWQLLEKDDIKMDWRFRLSDVTLQVPSNAGLVEKSLVISIAKYVNARDKDIDLSFAMIMNENQFENTLSLDASGMWDALANRMAETIGARAGLKAGRVKQGIGKAASGFRDFLDKKRKPAE